VKPCFGVVWGYYFKPAGNNERLRIEAIFIELINPVEKIFGIKDGVNSFQIWLLFFPTAFFGVFRSSSKKSGKFICSRKVFRMLRPVTNQNHEINIREIP